jgi:predicted alpha/beta-hydrolase family hydrolase
MDAPLLEHLATGLAGLGHAVARFEFPYMQAQRQGGPRRAPDRIHVLRNTWLEASAQAQRGQHLYVGGHSMGGRIASMIADEVDATGLLCVSYPFHPPRQPARTRVEHLRSLRTRALFLQGTRDPFGTPLDVATYSLSSTITVSWLDGADHSLKPPTRSGVTPRRVLEQAVERMDEFIRRAPHENAP